MTGFWAIIEDTWRQSKQQVVFFILLGLMALAAVLFVVLPKVHRTAAGDEVLQMTWQKGSESGLEIAWERAYREAILMEEGRGDALEEQTRRAQASLEAFREAQLAELERRQAGGAADPKAEARLERLAAETETKATAAEQLHRERAERASAAVERRAGDISLLRRGVESWLSSATSILFTLSMWLFIAASAGYFPGLLGTGAVDVVLAKPLGRTQIFFGKYVGGLGLYAAALLVIYLVIFLGVGVRTGVWHVGFFGGMPLTLFSVGLLFAIVGLIGVLTRSTPLAMIAGYFFYFVVDGLVSLVQGAEDALRGSGAWPWLADLSHWSKLLFPGFGRLKEAASSAVVSVPIFEPQVLLVASAWLGICLGLALYRFHRLDF